VTARGDLASDERSTIDLFEQAAPSVVFITTTEMRRGFFSFSDREVQRGTGSGFLWDRAGNVVTNYHVIADARRAQVTLSDGSTWNASLVGAHPDRDLAVLHIDAPGTRLQPIPIGVSHDLRVGQKVFAIGNPFGLDLTLTTGIISALGREIKAVSGRTIPGVIQTDAAINPGNSGGPLLDSAGRLIGVNTAIASPTGSYAGIGFAVPVDIVNRIVPQLIAGGKVERPGLGIRIAPDHVSRQFGGGMGVLIVEVYENSAAHRAGLRSLRRNVRGAWEGDVLVRVGDHSTMDANALYNALENFEVGDSVSLTIRRGQEVLELTTVLQSID
jgi:S1-C subfamily serine protease